MELTFTMEILTIVGSFTLSAIITMLTVQCLKDLFTSILRKNHKRSDEA